MTDPQLVEWSRQYRRSRCWTHNCESLVPLAQDPLFRGTYCQPCIERLRADADERTDTR